jgi:uncharacterized HhH-GPD family protein
MTAARSGPGGYHRSMAALRPDQLPFTGDPDADALVARDPLALLIGFVLDQQVPVQKAFAGPLELQRRIGGLEAARIAAMDPEELAAAFRSRPALHRFPAAMAARVQELCAVIVAGYGGDAGRVWADVSSGRELSDRLRALPGIGEMKAGTIAAILVRKYGVRPPGWEEVVPGHPTLADVDSAEDLARYQAEKRARKAAAKTARA